MTEKAKPFCHGCNKPADIWLTSTGEISIECSACGLASRASPRYDMAIMSWEYLQQAVIAVKRRTVEIDAAKRRFRERPYIGPYHTPEEAVMGSSTCPEDSENA